MSQEQQQQQAEEEKLREEKKHEEIELQDKQGQKPLIEGAKPKAAAGAAKDQLKEERVPLIAQKVAGPMMVTFSCMAGTVLKEEQMKFKRMIFRATRGRALTYFQDLRSEGQQDYAGIMDKRLRTIYVIVF